MKRVMDKTETGAMLLGAVGWLALIGVLFWLVCNCGRSDNADSSYRKNPWVNYDSTRPATDIKSLDYDRMMIIYRDDESSEIPRQIRIPSDDKMYDDPTNCYEDYYEELYEYYHD